MARKNANTDSTVTTTPTAQATERPRKAHRTPEQIVADYEAKIEAVRARAAARQAKATPANQALIQAVKALDKAIAIAVETGSEPNLRALQAAHAPLGELLISLGLRLPKRRRPRNTEAA